MEHRNPSTLIFLVNDDVRAIAVTYEDIDLSKDTTKMKYNPEYLSQGRLPKDAVVFKTMDPTIKVDAFVIIPTNTRHGMTVCKVVAVDIEIDYGSDKECHWIVGTVNTKEFERLRQLEDAMISRIKSAKVNDERHKLRESLLANMGSADLKRIPMFKKSKGKGGHK